MDLRVPTLIKFLNRLKSGTAAGNKIYIKGNRRNNFRILKKVVYLVYYLKAILKRGTLNIQLRMNPNSYCLIMAGGIGNRFWPVSNQHCPKQFSDIQHTNGIHVEAPAGFPIPDDFGVRADQICQLPTAVTVPSAEKAKVFAKLTVV